MVVRSTKPAAKKTKSTASKSKKAAAPTAVKKVSKPSPKSAPKPVTTTKVVEVKKPTVAAELIKKPELVDRVVALSGMKKKDVKPVVEATLDVLAKALINGEELQVPPLGKVMINQVKDVANATVLKVKIRHQNRAMAVSSNGPSKASGE